MTIVKVKFLVGLADADAWDGKHLRKVTGYGHGNWAEPGTEAVALLVEPDVWLVTFRWYKALLMTTEAAKVFLKSEERLEMTPELEEHLKNYEYMKEHAKK